MDALLFAGRCSKENNLFQAVPSESDVSKQADGRDAGQVGLRLLLQRSLHPGSALRPAAGFPLGISSNQIQILVS